ncbi:hypothetical protein [uncultured Treponema sp.]|uniref:hypothetical protein n=1 Tax=uncultured Treponema sp. TaxID=162155 RepID=UPI002630A4C7|nr:hypothetical protein [uncultured Treponema sp.]
MKTTTKTFIAVSMVGFAAMMFSCVGTKKEASSVQEATPAVQEQLDSATTSEAPLQEDSSSVENENTSSAQSEAPESSDASAPVAE